MNALAELVDDLSTDRQGNLWVGVGIVLCWWQPGRVNGRLGRSQAVRAEKCADVVKETTARVAKGQE
jgi:hypothetical protein